MSPLFPKGPSPNIKIVAVLIISLGLMMIDHAQEAIHPLRSGIAAAMQPLQLAAELPADAVEFLSKYIDRDELIAENKELGQKVLLLRARLQKLAALEAENERIRGLLSSASSLEEDVLIAEILAVSPDPYLHYMKLNKGSIDGVFAGQALVDANGIIGQVTAVNMMDASAIMITDANHGIPVEINRTGLQTIAQGTGKTDRLLLPFLANNADVREGDLLVSSGLGGRYPAGYPVATITRVSHQAGDEFLNVVAAPTASLNRGREALLVWTQQATHINPEANNAASPRNAKDDAQPAATAADTATSEQNTGTPASAKNPNAAAQ